MDIQEAQYQLQLAKRCMALCLDEDEKVPAYKEAEYTMLRTLAEIHADEVLHYRTLAYMDEVGDFPDHFEAETIPNHLEGEKWAKDQLWGDGR